MKAFLKIAVWSDLVKHDVFIGLLLCERNEQPALSRRVNLLDLKCLAKQQYLTAGYNDRYT